MKPQPSMPLQPDETAEEIGRTWLNQEREALVRLEMGRGVGVANTGDLEGMSGLQIMQGMMEGQLPYAECAKTMGFFAIEAAAGYSLFQGKTAREHLNPMGTVNGGWISAILDSTLGSAVLTALPAGQGYMTKDLAIVYKKALTLKTPHVRAEANVTRIAGSDAFAEAALYGPDGTIYAQGFTTCRIAQPSAAHVKK
jgi:uncharacterized protein (TIGR00369 family)